MEIMLEGKPPSELKWWGKCIQCGTIAIAKEKELKISNGGYRSDNEDFAWAACPRCRAKHSICFHREDTKSAKILIREVTIATESDNP